MLILQKLSCSGFAGKGFLGSGRSLKPLLECMQLLDLRILQKRIASIICKEKVPLGKTHFVNSDTVTFFRYPKSFGGQGDNSAWREVLSIHFLLLYENYRKLSDFKQHMAFTSVLWDKGLSWLSCILYSGSHAHDWFSSAPHGAPLSSFRLLPEFCFFRL